MNKINIEKRLLFDGKEEQLFDEAFRIEVENITVKFIPDEITSGRFNELQNKQKIIEQSDFEKNPADNRWMSEEGLGM